MSRGRTGRRGSRVVCLGGPIQHALADDGTFDHAVKSAVLRLIDALEGAGCQVFSAHRYEGFGELDVSGQSELVTRRDFGWLRRCDVFVALLPGAGELTMRSDGTCVELGWASALGKPIVMVRAKNSMCSHLILGMASVTEVVDLEFDQVIGRPQTLVEALARLPDRSSRLAPRRGLEVATESV